MSSPSLFSRATVVAVLAIAFSVTIGAPFAHAAFDDPLFVFRPLPAPGGGPQFPPPAGQLEGPCGLAVDKDADIYVSDYYHHAIDAFTSGTGYISQIAKVDPIDGPCGLAFGASGDLLVNNFHRNVVKFIQPGFTLTTPVDGSGAGGALEDNRPTGVAVEKASGNVYVDDRTHITAFDPAGAELDQIGSFADGYGIAASGGRVFVADAQTNTVLIYAPGGATPDTPVATISGSGTPRGPFTSLRNSAIAVDDASGEIYVADDLTPAYTSHHEGVVYVFNAAGVYEGRLKYSIDTALPPGLAVDNTGKSTQGRVYVTSGNSERAVLYGYPPHAATSAAVPLPALPEQPEAEDEGAEPVAGTSGTSYRSQEAPPPSADSVALPGTREQVFRGAKKARHKKKHPRRHHRHHPRSHR